MFTRECIPINFSYGTRLPSTHRMQNSSCALLDISAVSFVVVVYVTEFLIFCAISRRTCKIIILRILFWISGKLYFIFDPELRHLTRSWSSKLLNNKSWWKLEFSSLFESFDQFPQKGKGCFERKWIVKSSVIPLREKCPDMEFFLVRISCIQSEYRKIRTRKNFVFGHFSHCVLFDF